MFESRGCHIHPWPKAKEVSLKPWDAERHALSPRHSKGAPANWDLVYSARADSAFQRKLGKKPSGLGHAHIGFKCKYRHR